VIPLFALPLKQVAAWLSEPFQYTGIWILLCFVLNPIRLATVELVTTQYAAKSWALFCFYSLHRSCLGSLGTMTCWPTGCYLAGLYLSLGPPRRFLPDCYGCCCWRCGAYSLYLFAMVVILWVADSGQTALVDGNPSAPLAAEGWQLWR